MAAPRIGVYPGTFDPITNGHMDIVTRAAFVVDKLIVAVASNADKGPLFTVDERVEMVGAELEELRSNGLDVEVRAFDNLLIKFAQQVGATIIVRGMRAVADFEYEFQMATMNARLDDNIETVFLTASERQQFIAAGLVKEIARLGGNVSGFVSPRVAAQLTERFAAQAGGGA